MTGSASFDPTGAYRYALRRGTGLGASGPGGAGARSVCFVLLNPSTADARRDDPTIRRCVGFARAWGLGAVEVVNLCAWRSTEPRELAAAARRGIDVVGPGNARAVRRAAGRAGLVVAGWGAWGGRLGLGGAMLDRLAAWAAAGRAGRAAVLGWTAGGEPRHPLYVRGSARPVAVGSGGAGSERRVAASMLSV